MVVGGRECHLAAFVIRLKTCQVPNTPASSARALRVYGGSALRI